MTRLSEDERSQLYAGLIVGTIMARDGAGPFGMDCSCDLYEPCDACQGRDDAERRTFDLATAALVDAAVVEPK
jgi:hypothetical protein